MLKRTPRITAEADEEDVNVTPLLDIVFIMLIFFIVTTSFVKESGIDVNRPTANTAERKERGNIMIGIRENGEIYIDKRVVDVRSVRANVERLRAESPEGAVVITADKKSETDVLVQVIDQVKLAGVPLPSVATIEPE